MKNKIVQWLGVLVVLGGTYGAGLATNWNTPGKNIPNIDPATGAVSEDVCEKGATESAGVYGSGFVINPNPKKAGCGTVATADGHASGSYIVKVTLHTFANPDQQKPDICFAIDKDTGSGTANRCLAENIILTKHGGAGTGGVFTVSFTGTNLKNFWLANDGIRVVTTTNSRGFKGRIDVEYDDALGD